MRACYCNRGLILEGHKYRILWWSTISNLEMEPIYIISIYKIVLFLKPVPIVIADQQYRPDISQLLILE